ncbi:MAG: DNA polymerase III subunit delta' [Rhodoferax sp.]|nr:DNA polymerase III subunit delta' [Rhodoferax sp.]
MSIPSAATAPWIRRQALQLLAQRGHAWLLHGPSGLGQYALALTLAQTWLCEQAQPDGPCGVCGSCHAVGARTHADLLVLMPETIMLDLQWPLSEKAQSDIDEKKRKPSREIRVEALREAVEFAQRTSARGRGKVVLVYPAEDMNHISANALLKTLEEPVGDTRFVLATGAAHQLLPTIRSRCIAHTMAWPPEAESVAWIQTQGVAPDLIGQALQASGGRPEDAVILARSEAVLTQWAALPQALKSGNSAVLRDWDVPLQIDAAHKLCHDLMRVHMHASPRFFPAQALEGLRTDLGTLVHWSRQLATARKTMDHPFHAGLLTEALVAQAQAALHTAPTRTS